MGCNIDLETVCGPSVWHADGQFMPVRRRVHHYVSRLLITSGRDVQVLAYDTIRYIYVRSKADEMTSLI